MKSSVHRNKRCKPYDRELFEGTVDYNETGGGVTL